MLAMLYNVCYTQFQALREKAVYFAINHACSAYDKAEGLCLYTGGSSSSSSQPQSQASHINSWVFWQFIFCSCLPACISCVLCGYTERITCRSLKVSPFHKIVERSLCSSCLITCISCVLRADTWRSTCSISGLFVATWYCNHWWFHSGAALTRTWCADWFRVHAQTRAIISSRRPIDPIQSCGVVQRSPQAVFSSREEPFVVILVIYCRASSSSSNSSAGLSS